MKERKQKKKKKTKKKTLNKSGIEKRKKERIRIPL